MDSWGASIRPSVLIVAEKSSGGFLDLIVVVILALVEFNVSELVKEFSLIMNGK